MVPVLVIFQSIIDQLYFKDILYYPLLQHRSSCNQLLVHNTIRVRNLFEQVDNNKEEMNHLDQLKEDNCEKRPGLMLL